MSDTADALAAGGLLLTALTLVYTVWSPAIEASIDRTFSPGEAEKERQKTAVRAVRSRKALPIAIASWLILLAFLRRDLCILTGAAVCLADGGCPYDDVSAVFLLTQVLLVGLAAHVTGQVRSLNKTLRQA
jgi:hypothetical protein